MVRGLPWARLLFAATAAGTAGALGCALAGMMVPAWALATLAAMMLIALGGGIFLQGAGLFARPILAASPERSAGRLALTFDDGPHPAHTRAVLDLLDARGHRATFFVIG